MVKFDLNSPDLKRRQTWLKKKINKGIAIGRDEPKIKELKWL